MSEQSKPEEHQRPARTFSYRAIVIGIFATIMMATWIHFHEVLVPNYNVLAENSPPASAVGVILGILVIGGLITKFKARLRLGPAELVIIYTMLVTSAPIMSQGMWHRFLGFIVAIPHNEHNMPLADSFSEKLWPHGPQLVRDRRFEAAGEGVWEVHPATNVRRIEVAESPAGETAALKLENVLPADPDHQIDPADLQTSLHIHIPRRLGRRQELIPGERYYFSALFRLSDMHSQSNMSVELRTADSVVPVITLHRETDENFSNRGGFRRAGEPYVSLPRDTEETATLVFTLNGPGRAAIADVNFFSNEAIARLHRGSSEVRASDLARVPESDRDALLVRPDNLRSPAGIWYVLKGYIPYRQWVVPMLYWGSIVMAVFFCLLGIGVIMRRQWADKERFSFPMVVLPRLLLEEKEEGGRMIRPLFRKRTFYIGLAIAFVYSLWLGLAHYIPALPDPAINVPLHEYVRSPAAKALFNIGFRVILIYTAIAFFVDLDMLLSILVFFFLARIPYYLGEVFGWKTLSGPVQPFPFPHEQHMGAFIGLALIVLWISRQHLKEAFRTVFGLSGGVDDRHEAMSYRTAALLIAGSFIFFGVWGQMTGLGAGPALLFFGFLVICGLSAARIRTEMGAPSTYFTPYFPYLIFFLFGGLFVFGTETMVLAYCAGGFMAVAQFLLFAPTQVEMMHLGNQYNANPKGISKALILGMLLGVLVGGYVMLVWAYGVGGHNIEKMRGWSIRQDWYLNSLRSAVADANAAVMAADVQGTTPEVAYPTGPLVATGVGTGVTVLLTVLRTRFVGFWLHPIGYVLANTFFIGGAWGSLLTAWVIKGATLKIGGPRAVRNVMTPVMAGLFIGGVLGMAFWDVIAVYLMSRGVTDVFTCLP